MMGRDRLGGLIWPPRLGRGQRVARLYLDPQQQCDGEAEHHEAGAAVAHQRQGPAEDRRRPQVDADRDEPLT